jgi:hypothetical protein
MAKTKEQVRTLLRDLSEIREDARAYLNTDFWPKIRALKDEIVTADVPAEWMSIFEEYRLDQEDAANGFWAVMDDLMRQIHMPLGEYAGNTTPTSSEAANISLFNEKLLADSEAIETRGASKVALTPDGGNSGDGVAIELWTGADELDLDCGHTESLTMKCVAISSGGEGHFNLRGGEYKKALSEDQGTGDDRDGYLYNWGETPDEFSAAIHSLVTTDEAILKSMNGADSRNMVRDGGFEREQIGEDDEVGKIHGALILSGDPENVTLNDATPIRGTQNLNIGDDNANEIEFPLVGNLVGVPQFQTFLFARRGTITGNLNFIFRSGPASAPTDHFSITPIVIGSLTADVVTRATLAFVVPKDVGENPRIVIETDTVAGTGSIDIDELVAGVMSLVDSNRSVMLVEGLLPFERGDKFVGSNTMGTAPFQRMFNELFGRSIAHDGTPVYWTVS